MNITARKISTIEIYVPSSRQLYFFEHKRHNYHAIMNLSPTSDLPQRRSLVRLGEREHRRRRTKVKRSGWTNNPISYARESVENIAGRE